MPSEASQSTVGPSSTLWAQASKEWVIPAKPKPGRKPKKDPAAPKETHETDSKGRRVQNRAAQRAFRERKQSQLAELQARVQSYEQGEIERNVALQQVSKRLKEENDRLKSENASLKEEIARLREHAAVSSTPASASAASSRRDRADAGKSQKRWRDVSLCLDQDGEAKISLESASRKRFRPGSESPRPSATPSPQYAHGGAYAPSSPSVASSPDTNGFSRSPFSPLSFAPLPAPSESIIGTSSYATPSVFSGPSGDGLKTFDVIESVPPFDTFDCGLCTENTPCVCRELMQQGGSIAGMSGSLSGFTSDYLMPHERTTAVLKVEDTENRVADSISNIIEIPSASDDSNTSTSSGRPVPTGLTSYQRSAPRRPESLPEHHTNSNGPYEIRLPSPEPTPCSADGSSTRSVPLRLKNRRRSTSGTVWQVTPAPPTCSGDPSNCPACKDDDFGKAFCRALGDSAGTVAPACASCPNPEACGKASRSSGAQAPASITTPCSTTTIGGVKVIDLTPGRPEQDPTISRSSQDNSGRPSNSLSSLSTAPALPESPTAPSGPSNGKSPNASERIPANEAWARLKSHPNIAFADLSMLADVVARRTKCSGPIAVINPAPGTITPERDVAHSPAPAESDLPQDGDKSRREANPVLLSDPHAHFRAKEQQRTQISSLLPASGETSASALPGSRGAVSSALSLGPGAIGRPALVPQEELRECGRRRIREVDAAGVREALRILDAQFGKHS